MLSLLILAALVAAISAGCGGKSSGGSSQPSGKQQASKTTTPAESKAGGVGSSGRTLGGRLGQPALGSPDAPVVLTEYSDYQ